MTDGRKAKKNCKKLNKGFSLIEVLVAMTILALVTLPILSSFTSAAQINSKARKQENANTMGQQIAERFKSLSLFQLTDGEKTENTEVYDIYNPGTGVYTCKIDGMNYTDPADISRILRYNKYTFVMADYEGGSPHTDESGNVYCIGENGERFYVEVELNPSVYIENSAENTNPNGAFNSFDMPSFSDIKKEDNYILMDEFLANENSVKAQLEEAIRNNFASSHPQYNTSDIVDVSVELKNIKRKFHMELQGDKIKYSITYKTSGAKVTLKVSGKTIILNEGEAEITTVNKTASTEGDKNVYVFYGVFDKYGNNTGTNANDEVDILIDSGNSRSVYLVEQEVKNYNFGVDGETVSLKKENVRVNGDGYLNYQGGGFFTNADGYKKGMGITEAGGTGSKGYLYSMTVKIWHDRKGTDSDVFLKLETTKENGV